MQVSPDWQLGVKYLRLVAPELRPLLNQGAPCTWTTASPDSYFQTLFTGIVAQQLPPQASLQVMARLKQVLGEPLTAAAVLRTEDQLLLQCGLTQVKLVYVQNFARLVATGAIDCAGFAALPASKVLKLLLQVKGLGQWTIEMFMLLSLGRQDVFPADDFLLQKELQLLRHLPKLPKRSEVLCLTEKWRPWRGLGAWYLWQHSEAARER